MVDVIDRFAALQGVTTPQGANSSIADRWNDLRAAGVDDPGHRFGQWVDLALVGGVIPPLLANCRDVGELLQTLVRFHPLWGDDEILLDQTERGEYRLRLCGAGMTAAHRDTRDAFFTLLSRMLDHVTDASVRPTRQWHRTPEHDVVVFSTSQAATRLASADPSISAMLVGYAQAALEQNGGWVADVRRHIREDLASTPTLRSIATRLSYSPRTLQQRLADHGTSFSELVDDERRTRALAMLANRDTPISKVAFDVGFNSNEGFSRAFRRWTGLTPSAWRSPSIPIAHDASNQE
jgi:AraC-like DNA-binding protein